MWLVMETQDEPLARQFHAHLNRTGISSRLEQQAGVWQLWIPDEGELFNAKAEWAAFQGKPVARRYQPRPADPWESAEARGPIDWRVFWSPRRSQPSPNPWIKGLMWLTIGVFLLTGGGGSREGLLPWLLFDRLPAGGSDILQGQFWRLLTPIFLHFGLMHLIFNLLWFWQLGARIERRQGAAWLLGLIALIGIGSNLAQAQFGHAYFGGLSGVVYGLLGYLWLRGRLDPRERDWMVEAIFGFMLFFLVLGMTGILDALLGPLANAAHLAGLLLGMGCGWLSLQLGRRPSGRRY